ncbi:MAG: rhodanese-like domain-containing protein, partial [Acidimicrobiia bacterium]|nr:rhodanese-like domain-containing protein [Acidimicrobiia bacterium]
MQPQDLAQEMADGALVIDTRDSADREAEGALPGSVIINRNV